MNIDMGRPTSQTSVPPPMPLPGQFCLVEYDREMELYYLYTYAVLADPRRYDLGEDTPALRLSIGKHLPAFPDAMSNAIDVARDFGAAGVRFDDGRVIAQRKADRRIIGVGPKTKEWDDPATWQKRMASFNGNELDHGFPHPTDL